MWESIKPAGPKCPPGMLRARDAGDCWRSGRLCVRPCARPANAALLHLCCHARLDFCLCCTWGMGGGGAGERRGRRWLLLNPWALGSGGGGGSWVQRRICTAMARGRLALGSSPEHHAPLPRPCLSGIYCMPCSRRCTDSKSAPTHPCAPCVLLPAPHAEHPERAGAPAEEVMAAGSACSPPGPRAAAAAASAGGG